MAYKELLNKPFRLLRDIELMIRDFRESRFSTTFEAKANKTCHHHLEIRKNRWFRFHEVVACIYPKVAGGEAQNTFDMLVNKKFATEGLLLYLRSLVENLPQECGASFGTLFIADTLEPFQNDIVVVNPSYETPLPHIIT